jgi:hypothetical protein
MQHAVAGFATYVTCELAVRKEQVPSSGGRYELLTTVEDEAWARNLLTALGSMSLEVCLAGC